MQWPDIVHVSEIQTRLIHDGVPVDRAMSAASEVGRVMPGGRYRMERAQGDLYFYATVNPGYFAVASE
jgi:hypothetical protein